MSEKVEQYLAKKKSSAKSDSIANVFQKFEKCYTKKLWHQLTNDVKDALAADEFVSSIDLKELYDNFIHEFEIRINPIQLVEIAMPIATYIFAKDKQDAFNFLARIENTVKKNAQATVRVWAGQIELQLTNLNDAGEGSNINYVRELIEKTQKAVDQLPGVTPVHATFYKASSRYLRTIGNHAGYFREALRYLGCEDISLLSNEEKHRHAVLLGFAALLGENIYNFGELLAHPILDSLRGTDDEWLINLLFAFNAGDIATFIKYEETLAKFDDIRNKKAFLLEKLQLLSVMEIALARPSKERYITFDEIASKASVLKDNVEFLVMKALSKGLIRGSIDQVKHIVNISWVQPRVLSHSQISLMADRIGSWRADVEGMKNVMMDNAKEILVKN